MRYNKRKRNALKVPALLRITHAWWGASPRPLRFWTWAGSTPSSASACLPGAGEAGPAWMARCGVTQLCFLATDAPTCGATRAPVGSARVRPIFVPRGACVGVLLAPFSTAAGGGAPSAQLGGQPWMPCERAAPGLAPVCAVPPWTAPIRVKRPLPRLRELFDDGPHLLDLIFPPAS